MCCVDVGPLLDDGYNLVRGAVGEGDIVVTRKCYNVAFAFCGLNLEKSTC